MEERILGLHHITAIAGPAKRNLDFNTGVPARRLLKKTVNYDDPQTCHFYYGDETGSPAAIPPFFPWGEEPSGRRSSQLATEIGYAVPEGSFDFWIQPFAQFNVTYNKPAGKFT